MATEWAEPKAVWTKAWRIDTETSPKSGGQGSVTKVIRKADGQPAALKQLHDADTASTERRYRFQQEANALLALNGNGAPKLFEINVEHWNERGTSPYFVMEWISGPNLTEACSAGPMSIDEALEVTFGLLAILENSEALGLVHRDLKPDNIILRNGERAAPVLVDFGMSRTKTKPEEYSGFNTPKGQELGNRFVRLPEYAPGRHAYDIRSDLTMIVGLLFFLLTGAAPRQLLDAAGKQPHEAVKIADSVTQDRRWPRLRRLFGVGFQMPIDLRFQQVTEVRERMSNLSPPQEGDVQAELAKEHADIEALRATSAAKRIDQIKGALLEANRTFLEAVSTAIAPDFQCAGSGPNFRPETLSTHLDFLIHPMGASRPSVRFIHMASFQGGTVQASAAVLPEGEIDYYSGPLADTESLNEAARNHGGKVAVSLLRAIKDFLAEDYGV